MSKGTFRFARKEGRQPGSRARLLTVLVVSALAVVVDTMAAYQLDPPRAAREAYARRGLWPSWPTAGPPPKTPTRGIIHIGKDYLTIRGLRGKVVSNARGQVLAVDRRALGLSFVGAPLHLVDRIYMGVVLANMLGLEEGDLVSKLLATMKYSVIKKDLSDGELAAVREKMQEPDSAGLSLFAERMRLYPLGRLFGPVLGAVKQGRGVLGIERSYDEVLRESAARILTVPAATKAGRLYRSGWLVLDGLNGSDLVIGIDPRIQAALVSALVKAVRRERASGGAAVVLDVDTFQVLGLASVPSLDPNKGTSQCSSRTMEASGWDAYVRNPCINKAISYPFEPGSVGKVFTLAAGFEYGSFGLDTMVDAGEGRCQFGTHIVRDVKALGVIPIRDAIKYSSNCGMGKAGQRIGGTRMLSFFQHLGIGRPTGIDLPGERAGILRAQKKMDDVRTAAMSYGYGYTVNLVKLAQVMATIANGGVMGTPHVAIEYVDPVTGARTTIRRSRRRRVLSAPTARRVREALTAVVMSEDGTGRRARPRHYSAAGKTGTSRQTRRTGSRRRVQFYVSSFVGFAPADTPRIAVAVVLIGPRRHYLGGRVAGPVFAKVVDKTLQILHVPSDMAEDGAKVSSEAGT